MTEADKKREAEIRQRAIFGVNWNGSMTIQLHEAHNDRSYLLAALDREREKLARCKEALLIHDCAHRSLLQTEFKNEDMRHWSAADDLFWATMREIFGEPK